MRIEYHNGTGLLAVIGDPIAHSLSPLLQNTMIKALGRDDLYLAIPVARGGLPDFLQAAKTIGIRGFNLTMPHKEDVLPYLSEMTPEARRAGSVNTVRLEDGRFLGHSTDGIGFRRALADLDFSYQGKQVTILGAGGAAKSIAKTAIDSGAAGITVLNRTLRRAETLCQGEPCMRALELSCARAVLPETDLLVNTTPVGMAGTGTDGAFPDLQALKPGALAVDCIYAPAMTPFLAAARAQGHPVANGIGMLVYQAIYAYAFFCGEVFDEDTVSRLGTLLLDATGISLRGEP